jgi:hypothetical protein
MDKNTFGKSPCFVKLAEILDEINDEKLTSRVSKILHYYSGRLKKIDYLEGRNDRIYFASLVVNSQAKSVSQRFLLGQLPSVVYSHLLTCLKSRYKVFINEKQNSTF